MHKISRQIYKNLIFWIWKSFISWVYISRHKNKNTIKWKLYRRYKFVFKDLPESSHLNFISLQSFYIQEVNESPEILKYIWYPELEIYGLDTFGRQRVLKEMSGVRINKNKTITYELGVRITISCRMNFDNYPLDAQTCQFQVGSCKWWAHNVRLMITQSSRLRHPRDRHVHLPLHLRPRETALTSALSTDRGAAS